MIKLIVLGASAAIFSIVVAVASHKTIKNAGTIDLVQGRLSNGEEVPIAKAVENLKITNKLQ